MVDPDSPPRVLPLVADRGNRTLLSEWLDAHEQYRRAELDGAVSEATFDVCVLDEPALERHLDDLEAAKASAEPVLVPYLLLVPEAGPELIDADRGTVVDNVLTRQIDEIVTLPIRQTELEWRIDSLLRLRERSLQARRRQKQLEQYERAVEGSTDMLAAVDTDYRLLFANERYRAFHGLSADEVESVTLRDLLDETDFASIEPRVEQAMGGEELQVAVERTNTDGETRILDVTLYPLADEQGAITGVVAAMRDVTERKERERRLRRTRRAVEASGHAIYITDPDGTIEYVNPAFEEITGYDRDQALGENPRLLKSGEMSDSYYENLWETVRAGEVWQEKLINRRQDGDLYHARQTIAPITNDAGELEGFVAIQSDITEEVEAKRELATFKEIVQRLDDPIMLQDEDGRFRVANEAVGEYADRPVEELIGSDEFEFMDERTATEIARQKAQVLAQERPHTYEVEPSFPTRGERRFRTTRYPHYGEDGDLEGTVAICRDVTDLMERERQLAVLDRLLRHNLRSEMTVIRGYADSIAENPGADRKACARRIADATESLETLVEKERKIVDVLLDDDPPKRIDVCAAIERATAAVTDRHPECEVRVTCQDGITARAVVELGEAVSELVENAVVHADDSAPHVEVTVRTTGGSVMLSVADDGPGIPPMERRVLEGDADIDPLRHGSGLGLWFVNHVVTQSDGVLRFRENDPTGSVVEICVPAADAGAGDGD